MFYEINEMRFHQTVSRLTLFGVLLTAATAAAATAASQPHPGCTTFCGDIEIPFPFGTSDNCYLDDPFLITCNTTTDPPKPFIRRGGIEVLGISLDGQIRVTTFIARDCYNSTGQHTGHSNSQQLTLSEFPISNTRNRFTAIGCNTLALIESSQGQNYSTGCISLCDGIDSVTNGSCSGIGCCQTSIPSGVRDFMVNVRSFRNDSRVLDFNPCSYAFVVQERNFSFSSLDLRDMQNRDQVPVVLDWAVGNTSCQDARRDASTYACKAMHSQCSESSNGPGYRCSCLEGFGGNPYLIDGCQDIDECETSNPCDGTCTNFDGGYSCSCQEGYEGDEDGQNCRPIQAGNAGTILHLALGISIGLLVLLLGSSWIYWILKKRKLIKLREKFFRQNGGFMLQQQLSIHEGSTNRAFMFTSVELKKATDNYAETRVLGRGGNGTVYRGILPDGTTVAIKKSRISDQTQIEQFINEVLILSQINHRNIVRLLGCCLETEVPLLVYEFVANGTLSDRLDGQLSPSPVSWGERLRIAAETAGAISYLHSAASTPIIHRDVKSNNILLDGNFAAKVADFGASRLVPLDQTQLTTLVQGTFGYLDPEYFHSSQLTEKSDVYSFGVVLAELITGEKAISFERPERYRNLATYFVSYVKRGQLDQILEKTLAEEGDFEQIREVGTVAERCLRLKGEERPSMMEVAMELEGLRRMEKHPWVDVDLNTEEKEHLLGHIVPPDAYRGGNSSGYDSMMNHLIAPLDDGR